MEYGISIAKWGLETSTKKKMQLSHVFTSQKSGDGIFPQSTFAEVLTKNILPIN